MLVLSEKLREKSIEEEERRRDFKIVVSQHYLILVYQSNGKVLPRSQRDSSICLYLFVDMLQLTIGML